MTARTALVLALALAAGGRAEAQMMAPGAPQAPAASRLLPNAYSASVARLPPVGMSGPVDLAYGAYQRGFYATAVREATARLERDPTDAPAMTLMAELFNQGLGIRQDPAEAARWYRLAAGRGDASAMASLALMTADGRGVARDREAARRWFEEAAARGEPTASYNLALLLLASGTEAEIARAATLMAVAANAEIGDAQHALGVMYAQGRGVPRDRAVAAGWFRRAVKNGSLAAEVEYAIALANGDGVARDEPFAAVMFRRAALRGNAVAQNRIARLYATGRGVPKNLVEAAAWNLVAAGQGLADSWLDAQIKELPPSDRARVDALAAARQAGL